MIYTHVLNKGGHGVPSPLDRLEQRRGEYRIQVAALGREMSSSQTSKTSPIRLTSAG